MTPDLELAVKTLSLEDIALRRIQAEASKEFLPFSDTTEGIQIQTMSPRTIGVATFQPKDAGPGSDRLFVYEVRAVVRILPHGFDIKALSDEELDAKKLAYVETLFVVTYREPKGTTVTEQGIEQFGAQNVPFNVWPYWRETVHAACSRLGLPRVVLPLHRLRKLRDPKAPVPQAKEEGELQEPERRESPNNL